MHDTDSAARCSTCRSGVERVGRGARRDPVADRIGAVVVAACARTVRHLTSEFPLGPDDGMAESCVASFDNLHTLRKHNFRSRITTVPAHRDRELCAALDAALGCPR